MEKSDSIIKLAKAMIAAQSEIKVVEKEAVNPYFKSKYADLPAIFKEYQRAFLKQGLVVVQIVEGMGLRTTILHDSGEWMSGLATLNPVKDDPQGLGSAITYMRRYGLAAICGIVSSADDDDGNAGTGQGHHEQAKTPATPHTLPQRKSETTRPTDGIKTATGFIIDQKAPNRGGFVAYILEGYVGENGKPTQFSTKDTMIIETLDEHRAKGEKVSVEYTENANPAFANSIRGLVQVKEEIGDAQEV